MRKIYVDFDGTLYDTEKLKELLVSSLSKAICGKINKPFDEIFDDVSKMFCREKIYNIFELCCFYENKFGLSENLLCESANEVFSNGEKLLFEDSIEFLKEVKSLGFEVNILTYVSIEDHDQQMKKIIGSNISKFYDNIIMCSKDKGELGLDYENGIFVDDNPKDLVGLFKAGVKPENLVRVKRENSKYSLEKILEFTLPEFENLNNAANYIKSSACYENNLTKRKKVVVLGGGTGTSVLLGGLKDFPVDITAVICVSDNGSSTGRLRREFLIPAVGDIRKVLSSLSPLDCKIKGVMEQRLKTTSDLNGHAIGNLVLTSYLKATNSLEESIKLMSELLDVKQKVLPLSEDLLTLMGETVDGEIVEGEENIDLAGKKYKRIFYKEELHILSNIIDEIMSADLVLLSMGSLYTSLIPNLICPEIVEAIKKSPAKVMYVCNLFTQVGVTDDFRVSDYLRTVEQYVGKNSIDCMVVNDETITKKFIEKYKEEKKEFVKIDYENLKDLHCEIIKANLVSTSDGTVKHDTMKLGSIIFSYMVR